MFRNIGGKIKVAVIVAAVLGIIGCICFGAVVILYSVLGESLLAFLKDTGLDKAVTDMTGGAKGALGVVTGVVIMTAGSFLVYLAAFIPYGLGQLIQNTDKIVKSLDTLKDTSSDILSGIGDVQNGVYAYPVYVDEYGRPCNPAPDDTYFNDEAVADGDLVPDSVIPQENAVPDDEKNQDSKESTEENLQSETKDLKKSTNEITKSGSDNSDNKSQQDADTDTAEKDGKNE